MYRARNGQLDRLYLTHHVLNRVRDWAYFSADQVARATYYGAGKLHPQQKKRVEALLEKYVHVWLLERIDDIARCQLYRHTGAGWHELDANMLFEFESHSSRRWSRQHEIYLMLIDQVLDWLIPRQADPACYTRTGALLLRPCRETPRDVWGRLVDPCPPSALAYVRERVGAR
ncbi:MAG: hypothetical protein R3C12_00030 [Planctomycetaceae bacterium]